LNCVEKHIQKKIKENYPDRYLLTGRCAHLTKPAQSIYNRDEVNARRAICAREVVLTEDTSVPILDPAVGAKNGEPDNEDPCSSSFNYL